MMMNTTFDPFSSDIDPFWNPMRTAATSFTPTITDIASRFPRHVASRIFQSDTGDEFWRPATDIYDTDSDIVVHCDLPGVPKDEIKMELENDQLTISGEHKGVSGFSSASSRVRERRIGKFRKIVRLPLGADTSKIVAKHQDGLLEVHIPKTETFSTGKRIELT